MATPSYAKRVLRWLAIAPPVAIVFYLLAGRTDLPRLHGFVAIVAGFALAAVLWIDPALISERARRGQETTDPVRLALIRLGVFAAMAVAALDVGRFHWSDTVPAALGVAGLVGFAGSLAFVFWAVAVNRFFLPVIRLQTERGHRTVDTGPYRLIRHPGYAGMVVACPAAALAIGSWWALALAAFVSLLFLWRIADEDRFLAANLQGYADYRERVRFRLLPGVW